MHFHWQSADGAGIGPRGGRADDLDVLLLVVLLI